MGIYIELPVANVVNTPQVGASLDAFGRQRISEPVTLFDSKQIHDNQPLFWDDQETSGSGTSTSYSTDTASTTISVGASTAGTRIRQSFQHFNYQPGKSHLILMTGTFTDSTTDVTGLTSEIGYFDDNNGVFARYKDGSWYFVIRSSASGTPVDNAVPQSQWSADKFNGSGSSGVDLDPTKTNILVVDMEWLGVGRVRVGWNIDGITYYAHEFFHANLLSVVYMSTANLPLRYSISNDGNAGAHSMQHICSSVQSEGGRQEIGLVTTVSNGTTVVTATNANTYYALKGVRISSDHIGDSIIPEAISVAITSGGVFEWQLRVNPTVAGTFTYSDGGYGYDVATGTSSNTVTNGVVIAQGYGTSSGTGANASGTTGGELNNALLIGQAIDGTTDTLVLCVAATSAGETFLGGMTLRQLS